jgi:hypothetical protein
MMLEVSWDGLRTFLLFGLSQLHGHGSWLEGEVAVSISFVLKFIPLKELFTPWTMKSSQGPMKFMIGF